jgi:hypothetical protein
MNRNPFSRDAQRSAKARAPLRVAAKKWFHNRRARAFSSVETELKLPI